MLHIVYDCKLDRPACAVVAAGFGVDSSPYLSKFDADKWVTAPTPDMAIYPITPEQVDILAKRVNSA